MTSSHPTTTLVFDSATNERLELITTQLSRLLIPQGPTTSHTSSAGSIQRVEEPSQFGAIMAPPNTPTLEESQSAMAWPTDYHFVEEDLDMLNELLPFLAFEVFMNATSIVSVNLGA